MGEEDDSGFVVEGNAIKFSITLDPMGGDDGYYNPNKDLENYIDPDKVRVLFFTEDDKFLFESKSRWIKKSSSAENTGFYKWEVLVPFFTHGNDQVNEYDWPWEDIREYMTTKPFKIAILANRPDREWNLGIMTKAASDAAGAGQTKFEPTDTLVQYGWFGNHGPYWTKANTYKMDGSTPEADIRDVFDLHHCQYDPIYDGKNWDNEAYGRELEEKPGVILQGQYIGFYDHIAEMHGQQPWMGATSSWINWGTNDNIRTGWDGEPAEIGSANYNSNWNGVRNAAELTKEHPIPMYGIQLYAPLTSWEEGTTFNLGRDESDYKYDGELEICKKREQDVDGWKDRAVSLLRSVVKLELILPSNIDPEYVAICYTNIYARCEPADTWTPTEDIWDEDHYDDCEWKYIQNYGPMAYNGAPVNSDGKSNYRDIYTYQKRLSWLYGVWKEKGWKFISKNKGKPVQAPNGDKDFGLEDVVNEDGSNGALNAPTPGGELKYPRVFNSCIQRNNNVHVPKYMRHQDTEGNYHYIVYMGERNVNDPTNLSRMGNRGSGNPTVIYWQLATKSGTLYSFNLNDSPTVLENPLSYMTGPNNKRFPAAPGSSMVNQIETKVMDGDIKNWPLVRNHVYRIWVNGTTKPDGTKPYARSSSPLNISARGAVSRSRSIDFNKALFHWSQPNPNVGAKPAESIIRK